MKPTPLQNPPHLRCALARAAAACAEPFYASVVALRNVAYDRGVFAAHRAHVPVVSVGNLTTGGTGKTPMVIELARRLIRLGATPAILLRGYRSESTGGSDERQLLQESLPDTPILALADRVEAASQIARQHPKVSVLLLDDGFQHRRLRRDLDLVLLDATNPFGHGHVLPRGLMREKPGGLRRAHAVIVTHADRVEGELLRDLDRRIAGYHGKPPVAHAAHRWARIVDGNDRTVEAGAAKVWAVAGIGNPGAFLDQAAQRFDLLGSTILRDHAAYTPQILEDVRRHIALSKPDAILTTGKDWVKLRPLLQSHPLAIPMWRPELAIEFLDGEDVLRKLLSDALT